MSRREHTNKIVLGFAFVILAAVVQVGLSFSPVPVGDFVLLSVVVASFFLPLSAVFPLSLFAAAILLWTPAPGVDSLLIILIPFGTHILMRHLPWKTAITALFSIIAAIVVFYLAIDARAMRVAPESFFAVLAWDVAVAGLCYAVFRLFYSPVAHRPHSAISRRV